MSNTRRLGLIVGGIAVAVLAFLVLRPTPAPEPASAPQQASDTKDQPSTTPPRPAPKPRYQSIPVPSGEAADVAEVEVKKGETVRLSFRAEGPGEIHIHGYDRYVQLKGGRAARVAFEADIDGVFEVENHDTGAPVAELKVEP